MSVAFTTGWCDTVDRSSRYRLISRMPTGMVRCFQRFDLLRQPLRQRHAAAADADERQLVQVSGALQNFVRQADQRPVDFRGAHQLGFFAGDGHGG